jgi:hypothetical protein
VRGALFICALSQSVAGRKIYSPNKNVLAARRGNAKIFLPNVFKRRQKPTRSAAAGNCVLWCLEMREGAARCHWREIRFMQMPSRINPSWLLSCQFGNSMPHPETELRRLK